MTAALKIDDLCIRYRTTTGFVDAVQNFSLSIEAGHIASLLGPSGCGKTSVLRAIAGFEPVHQGTIQLGEMLLASAQKHLPPEQRKVGMMFQEYGLFPHLTVAQNIAFGLRRTSKDTQLERVQDLLQLIGLPDAGQRFPHELSGGQQQRIALARALAPSPALLLLDEAFSNLDETTRTRLTAQVRQILKDAGQTALMVTHNEAEAHAMSDQTHVFVHR